MYDLLSPAPYHTNGVIKNNANWWNHCIVHVKGRWSIVIEMTCTESEGRKKMPKRNKNCDAHGNTSKWMHFPHSWGNHYIDRIGINQSPAAGNFKLHAHSIAISVDMSRSLLQFLDTNVGNNNFLRGSQRLNG